MSKSPSSPDVEEASPAQITPTGAPTVRTKPNHWVRLVIGTVALGVALFFGLSYLADNWARESTDDAFIDGHIVSIASKAPGEVVAMHVVENQAVKAGDLLVEVDPRDYEVRVSQKRAALDSAKANEQAIKAGFDLMRARVNTAEATQKQSEAEAEASKSTYDNAEINWNRSENMWTNESHKVISEQDFDTSKAIMTTAKANWQADVDKAASDASRVVESRAQLETAYKLYDEAGAQVSQSEADVHAAELELSYTKITAPVDGRITRKMVEQGAYVQLGQNLLAIVQPEIWITANFKETQTAKIRAGQPVRIKVDGMGDRALHGHVESLQSGSGARFSLLPPENAVGNYVKVVQRVPVKIVFDEPVQAVEGLGPGMSVSPSVEVGRRVLSDPVIAVIVIILAPSAVALFWVLMQRRSKNQKQP
ncbi:MAG TPA: HlyD family secretion protein [Verrucomicrobiae bacterium]|jgi:membrane fusion protein (multidrug efflux system)|nr:HlyD family secretion protein [Verrucomicrobiae bacterium]